MKRKIILSVIVVALFTLGITLLGTAQSHKNLKSTTTTSHTLQEKEVQREARHKEREARRAQRLADYEHYLDSIVLVRNFQFNPQNMQQQPAGAMRQLYNPNFALTVWGDEVDVCLPYIKGMTPPYYFVIMNYTLPMVSQYVTEQTHEGWHVTFTSTLFSASTYRFSLEIYSSSGSATLTISNPWYPDVQYTGSITGIN